MEPLVDCILEDDRWEALGLAPLADRAVRAALAHLGMPPDGFTLCLMGCNDARIAVLNADFRGKATATNVLSWPSEERGAEVVGADAAPRNIPVAQIHAEQSGLTIDYRHTTAEDLAAAGEQFDVVLNMEVVEHVADPLAYLTACQQLLKPGGLMICSTLNRNPKSFVMAIIGAEWVMRWLPKGTHDWAKFITPDELYGLIRQAGLDPVDKKGMVFNPVSWRWAVSDRDLSVNYVTASIKR